MQQKLVRMKSTRPYATAQNPDLSYSFRSFGFGLAAAEAEYDQQMSGDFQLAFKKVAKKDATTRQKGLIELKALFSEKLVEKSSEETAVVARWSKLWAGLLSSSEHKVRVAALETMGALAKHLGRYVGLFAILSHSSGAWDLISSSSSRPGFVYNLIRIMKSVRWQSKSSTK